jgi:predicted nucleic acid-binding protein
MDQNEVGLFASALSLFEMAGVLKGNGLERKIREYWGIYTEGLAILPADADLVQSAWDLREEIGKRIPIADAIIAATARSVGATLVHNDRHLAQIPVAMLPQIRFPSDPLPL